MYYGNDTKDTFLVFKDERNENHKEKRLHGIKDGRDRIGDSRQPYM